MEENENQTPDTPADPPAEPSTPAEPQAAPAPPPVVPEGYVAATEVESVRAELTAAQTAREAAETARVAAETARDAALTEARNTQINAIATRLGFNDPADAQRFLDPAATDIEAALTEVLKSKSYLGKQEAVTPPVTPTNPNNPARPEALTLELIKAMTPAQINARWADVKAVLHASGQAVI